MNLTPLRLERPRAGQVGADDVDRAQRRLDQGGDRDQSVGPVRDDGQGVAGGDGRARGATGSIHAGVEHAVRVACQHAIQSGCGSVAQFDQNHDVGVRIMDGASDSFDVGVPCPQVGGIEGQRRRAFAGQRTATRQPLGPDSEGQKGGDSQTSDHGGAQPENGVNQRQNQRHSQ